MKRSAMKEISYRCNVCLDGLPPASLVGFEFDGAKSFRIVYCHESERHICKRCLKAFYFLSNKVDADDATASKKAKP